jgi:hypothetical protein
MSSCCAVACTAAPHTPARAALATRTRFRQTESDALVLHLGASPWASNGRHGSRRCSSVAGLIVRPSTTSTHTLSHIRPSLLSCEPLMQCTLRRLMPVGVVKLCTKGAFSMRPWMARNLLPKSSGGRHLATTGASLPRRLHRKVCLNPRMRPLAPAPGGDGLALSLSFSECNDSQSDVGPATTSSPHGRSHLQCARPDWFLVGRPHGRQPALGTPASGCFPNLAINHSAVQKTTQSSR